MANTTAATTREGASTGAEPPGPDGLPLLGNTLSLMRDPIDFVDELATYGDVVRYRIAGLRFTVVLHPDYVEQVLVDDHDRFRRWTGADWGGAFSEYGTEGLLLTEGEQWRRQRKLIQDAFTMDRIESYADAIAAETERTAARLSDGETVDLVERTSALTLRILTRSLFDLDVEGRRGEVVRRAARALNDTADTRSPTAFLPTWVPTPRNRRLHRAMADLEDVFDEIVAERRADPGGRDDLLSLLLAAGDGEGGGDDSGPGLSEREVRDQLLTFLFAGHETTSLALTYALHALAHDDERRRRVRAEVEDVSGGDPPTTGDLAAMPYTDRVVTETLRLYPPAYAIFREAREDATVGGYRVPAGSKLTLPQIRIHRDERFYDEPDAFKPERWVDALEDELPDYAYFPFGGGPRHCIGMRLARLELRIALPTLLSAVDVEPVGERELSFEPGVTLRPADPVRVRVRR